MTPETRDHGATAVEYSLSVGLIALVIFGSVLLFGQAVVRLFDIPCGPFIDC